MAINLPGIASTYYSGSCSSDPVTFTEVTGYGFPYSQWPASLQAQYAYNPTEAQQLLAAAGYPKGFNTDIVIDTASDMGLIQIVQSEFAAIGVNMAINVMPYATWTAFVTAGHKNDALASRSTGGDIGLAQDPIIDLNKFMSTNQSDQAMVNDPVFDAFKPAAMTATSVDQVKQIVANANEYVAQQHFCISLLQTNVYSFIQPWLKGYSGQFGATYGNYGPPFLSFYPARFWIVPH